MPGSNAPSEVGYDMGNTGYGPFSQAEILGFGNLGSRVKDGMRSRSVLFT